MDRSPRPPERGLNWLGVASLIIGLFSLTFTWVPLIGCSTIPLAILGPILGLDGVLTARGGRTGLGFPVAGVVASLLAILVPITGDAQPPRRPLPSRASDRARPK